MRCAIFALFLLVESAIGLEHGLMQKEKYSTELQPLDRAGKKSKPKTKIPYTKLDTVDCDGPPMEEGTGDSVKIHYCPAKAHTSEDRLPVSYASVQGAGTNALTIGVVDTSNCKRGTKVNQDQCYCEGLVSEVLKKYATKETEAIELIFAAVGREDRQKACRCFLKRAREVADFRFVQLQACNKYQTQRPIYTLLTTHKDTCIDIFKQCPEYVGTWVFTKTKFFQGWLKPDIRPQGIINESFEMNEV